MLGIISILAGHLAACIWIGLGTLPHGWLSMLMGGSDGDKSDEIFNDYTPS